MFFGTPGIAVPALRALNATTNLVGVVCQPDRRAGRGMKLTAPAVKLAALELGVEVHQPVKVRTGDLDQWLREREVELAVVLAYGRILPQAVLDAPTRGCVNLHASLLPELRGAAPINWAILNGATKTGLSLMQMDAGLDTGPVFTTCELTIGATENAGELTERMALAAAEMVERELPRVISGELIATAQDHAKATHAPPLDKAALTIDWSRSAQQISDWVRGLAPIPGARTTCAGKSLKLIEALPSAARCPSGEPGEVVLADRSGLIVSCGGGHLEIRRAQPEGRKALGAADLINGRMLSLGDRLGS